VSAAELISAGGIYLLVPYSDIQVGLIFVEKYEYRGVLFRNNLNRC